MKINLKHLAVLTVVLFLATPAPAGGGEIPISVKKLSERTLLLTYQGGDSSNIVAINSEKGIVVIDSTNSPLIAREIRKRIDTEFPGKPYAYLINTHHHGDHTYGNQVFADAVVIGHENCRSEMAGLEVRRPALIKQLKAGCARMKERLSQMEENSPQAESLSSMIQVYELIYRGLESDFILTPPGLTFRDRLDLYLGDVTLNLVYFGTAHSTNDIFISCPEEGILMTGDTLYPEKFLYIDTERIPFLSRWRDSLEFFTQPDAGIKQIIPSHVEPFSPEELDHHLKYVQEKIQFFQGKSSGLTELKQVYEKSGPGPAAERLRELHRNPEKYFFLHPEIDQYVYRLMLKDKLDDAAMLFEAIAELFPESAIAFDSLGEVYIRKGDKARAIKSFEKSLELDPDNRNAINQLKQLK